MPMRQDAWGEIAVRGWNMSRPERPVRARLRLVGPAALLALASLGCDPSVLFDAAVGTPSSPFTLLSAPLTANEPAYDEAEPNNDFSAANAVSIGANGGATIHAALDDRSDVDVFGVGAAGPGDRLLVTIRTASGLTASIGVFDDRQNLLQFVSQAGGTTPMYFETICRETITNLYVMVAAPAGMPAQGAYSLEIRRSAGDAPPVNPQVILLDFDGDPAVSIGGGPTVSVPPFDAARISAAFAGQTAVIRKKVLEDVRAQFAGLNVTVRSTDEPDATAGPHSTLYFGTYNADLLGLADTIDSYNQDTTQSAIIFTDTFALFNVLAPSVDEIAQVLANVASHEAGHLLGLWHTSDPTDLMDITATARQLLRPQAFRHAPLHTTVSPIGWQNAPDLLAWAVGGRLKTDTSNLRIMPPLDDGRGDLDFEIDRRLLSVSAAR